MTYSQFVARFPNNDACMDFLRDRFYPAGSECPSCHKATKFHRIKSRSAYACQLCRHQVYPTAQTIFHKSTTSLQLWFWAIYLMSSTRCGISAKNLEREVGVSYPTALRMFRQIRSLLTQDGEPLSGTVEMDEAYLGPNPKWMHRDDPRKGRMGRGVAKTPVFGMVQRASDGTPGRIMAKVVSGVSEADLLPEVRKHVLPSSTVYTDEWAPYAKLSGEGYMHSRIPHAQKVYVDGDVHVQTLEGFWSLLKGGLRGVYHSVSDEYLQDYIDEYVWRWNHREDERPMFWTFLDQVRKADGPAS
jgi:transposase